MTMVKTLVALATERMLLKTSGPTFLRGIEFMYAAGLAPDRLSVMMTSSHKFVLQFHSKCDIRPFAANYPNFGRVLRGIVHVREWRIKSIEFVNVAFYMRDVDNLERAIEKLGVELVLLRNCTYPGVQRGDEAVKFLSALNRKKQAVVCEYGDDRLKHRIGRRSSGHRTRRASRNGNGQEVVVPPQDPAEIVVVPLQEDVAAPAEAADAQPAAGQNVDNDVPVVPDAPEALNVAPVPMPVRRPIAVRQQAVQQGRAPAQQGPPAAQDAGLAPPAQAGQAAAPAPAGQGRAPHGRVVVGAHVYEFRAVDVPNVENIPAVENLGHLLHVLNENAANDVRVIVLPEHRGQPGMPGQPNLNNNNGFPGAVVGAMPPAQLGVAHLNNRGVAQMNYGPLSPQESLSPPQPGRPQPQWNYHVTTAPAGQMPMPRPLMIPLQVPMFGVAVNEPQVQQMARNGDDSNDSTDREELYDAEHQRNEALRDLVADPEALPNFAPVEAQAIDLDMLEEEGEGEDDVMEGVIVDGQYVGAMQ